MGRVVKSKGLVPVTCLCLVGLAGCDLFFDETGGEGQACFPGNNTCKGSLFCVEGFCRVDPPDGGLDGGEDGRDPGDDGDTQTEDGGDSKGDEGGDVEEQCLDSDLDTHFKYDGILCPSGTDYCDDDGYNHSLTGCEDCEDADGDGYGTDCDWGPDCDDVNGSVHQGCPPVYLFRSVGFDSVDPLASGPGADITISESSFLFDNPPPGNIGVGDVIQYSTDGDAIPEALAVIVGRTHENEYSVTDAEGIHVDDVTSPGNWSIFRAYTSLRDALNMRENPGLDAALADFDDEYTEKDLTSKNRVWNIACYADAVDLLPTSFTIDIAYWTSTDEYFLKIYTPHDSSEVGLSQRHQGRWTSGNAYILEHECGVNATILRIGQSTTVHIDGLQFHKKSGGAPHSCNAIEIVDDSMVLLSNNIIRGTNTKGNGVSLSHDNARLKMWNNVIYDMAIDNGSGIELVGNVHAEIYNNTIYNSYRGVYSESNEVPNVLLMNNLAVGNTGYDFDVTASYAVGSDYNCSLDVTARDLFTNGENNCKANEFVDAANGDFHLNDNAVARDEGYDLIQLGNVFFQNDIDLEPRPQNNIWDIGADEYHP